MQGIGRWAGRGREASGGDADVTASGSGAVWYFKKLPLKD